MLKKHLSSGADVNTILKAACVRNKNKKAGSKQRDDHFTLEDVDRILSERKEIAKEAPETKVSVTKKPAIEVVQEKRVFKAASLADILGFNPHAAKPESEAKEHDLSKVSEELKPYYLKLVQLRDQLKKSIANLTQAGLKHAVVNEESDAFQDPLLGSISSDKAILKEVEAAIERNFEGTYGICEITGKPILKKRLDSIPYTRYSLEGQEQVEAMQKSRQLAQLANGNVRISDEDDEGSDTYFEDDSGEDL